MPDKEVRAAQFKSRQSKKKKPFSVLLSPLK